MNCQLCAAENRMAPAEGPTCPHQPWKGADWWPDDYMRWPDDQRLKWHARRVNFVIDHALSALRSAGKLPEPPEELRITK